MRRIVPSFTIPPELVAMAKSRRVIPFIGAGFSSALGLPSWEELLSAISDEIEGEVSHRQVQEYCQRDNLQMAEYYFLKSDRSVGPLRHAISQALRYAATPVERSGAHVELVNLGAPQVYTTNFDEAIERTYRDLGEPVQVVALPKHVATVDGSKAQIVKYHGDLRHEQTLVLTESSYYARLDFESPMDVKFRSDILGRSVLFMGYSFRDINIRVIWFKLMRMMKDIPPNDRPTSYIVTFAPNPVLELLYSEVGINTIILDPKHETRSNTDRSALLAQFLFELVLQTSENSRIVGNDKSLYMSKVAIDTLLDEIDEWMSLHERERFFQPSAAFKNQLEVTINRRIPPALGDNVVKLMARIVDALLVRMVHYGLSAHPLAGTYVRQYGPNNFATELFVLGIDSIAVTDAVRSDHPWKEIWAGEIREPVAELILKRLDAEIGAHKERTRDNDIAYLSDIATRIARQQLLRESKKELIEKAGELLDQAGRLYPTINELEPKSDKPPRVQAVIAEIEEKRTKSEQAQDGDVAHQAIEDDIPF